MGRPRKRQFIEVAPENSKDGSNSQHLGLLPLIADDSNVAVPYLASGQPAISEANAGSHSTMFDDGHDLWNFGDDDFIGRASGGFPAIDHESGGTSDMSMDSLPLSTISNMSQVDGKNPPPNLAGPCSCLASMYLALASLQQLPIDVVNALATVRGAAKTAAMTLHCPRCGFPSLENTTPLIEGFQNTMLLGTVLPIIANSYKTLLQMVDTETELATAAGQLKKFRFHDYGGLCPQQETVEQALDCATKEMFFAEVDMPPAQWRNTVQTLLRVDIYGHGGADYQDNHHKGLKELVATMENRQIARHAALDIKIAAGYIHPGHFGLHDKQKCLGERDSPFACLQIIKMAKMAIDDLDIPE